MSQAEQQVYIIEDDEAVRESEEMMLESIDQPFQSFVDAPTFLEAYTGDMAGCILLDVRMPGMNGLELHKILIEKGCTMPVIFVTGHGDIQMAVDAMQRGAADFVTKPYREQELLDKIYAALEKDADSRSKSVEVNQINERLATLTAREAEVMAMMVDGKANKVIGFDLEISERTVEIHRGRVMKKMGTHSLAQLVQMVLRARGEI